MSLDRSLRMKNALVRHRNVLRRSERITTLKDQEKWEDGRSVFGLPKVAHRKVATKKAKAAVGEEAAAAPGAEGAAAAPAVDTAAPVKGAKAAPAAAAPAKKDEKAKGKK